MRQQTPETLCTTDTTFVSRPKFKYKSALFRVYNIAAFRSVRQRMRAIEDREPYNIYLSVHLNFKLRKLVPTASAWNVPLSLRRKEPAHHVFFASSTKTYHSTLGVYTTGARARRCVKLAVFILHADSDDPVFRPDGRA